MSVSTQLLGLRHAALFVTDMVTARAFYIDTLGLSVVWEPDPDNVYLSSGCDNIALHSCTPEEVEMKKSQIHQRLDHLGFVLATPEDVRALSDELKAAGVPFIKEYKEHRDGAHSFYVADPDGNVIQMLYEPNISPLKLS